MFVEVHVGIFLPMFALDMGQERNLQNHPISAWRCHPVHTYFFQLLLGASASQLTNVLGFSL